MACDRSHSPWCCREPGLGDSKAPGLPGSQAGWHPCPSTGDRVRQALRQLLHPEGSWQRPGRVPRLFPPLAGTPRACTHISVSQTLLLTLGRLSTNRVWGGSRWPPFAPVVCEVVAVLVKGDLGHVWIHSFSLHEAHGRVFALSPPLAAGARGGWSQDLGSAGTSRAQGRLRAAPGGAAGSRG